MQPPFLAYISTWDTNELALIPAGPIGCSVQANQVPIRGNLRPTQHQLCHLRLAVEADGQCNHADAAIGVEPALVDAVETVDIFLAEFGKDRCAEER